MSELPAPSMFEQSCLHRDQRRRRATAAAALAGAALFLAGAVVTIGGFATAIGGYTPAKPIEISPSEFPSADASMGERRASKSRAAFGASRAVCVRLCDGFFFPTSSTVGGDEACESQCPDAPVAMYSQPGDAIENAVSLTGERYADLPAALRNRATFDNACTCHRSYDRSRVAELLRDVTLRKGDVVMTGKGFRVFEGAGGGESTASDFVALSSAPNFPKNSREALLAMEQVGAARGRPATYGAASAAHPIEPWAAAPQRRHHCRGHRADRRPPLNARRRRATFNSIGIPRSPSGTRPA
jgi:hypothetical protein